MSITFADLDRIAGEMLPARTVLSTVNVGHAAPTVVSSCVGGNATSSLLGLINLSVSSQDCTPTAVTG